MSYNDNFPPSVSYVNVNQYNTSNSSAYAFPNAVNFTANISDPDGNLATVYAYLNGTQTNVTGTNSTTWAWNFYPTLAAGYWNVTWQAFDSAFASVYDWFFYYVQRGTLTLSSSVTTPITYGTASNYAASESNGGDEGCTYEGFRNGTSLGTGSSISDTTILASGLSGSRAYNYSYGTDGCGNYTAAWKNDTLIVNAVTPTCTVAPTTQTITYGTPLTQACYCTSPETPCTLWRGSNSPTAVNRTSENNTAFTGPAINRVFFSNVTASQNYSVAASAVQTLTTNKANSATNLHVSLGGSESTPLTFVYNPTSTYNRFGRETNSVDTDATYAFLLNGSAASNNTNIQPAVGAWNYTLAQTNAACENFTVGQLEHFLIITQNSSTLPMSLTGGNVTVPFLGVAAISGTEGFTGDLTRTYSLLLDGLTIATGSSVSDARALSFGSHNYTYCGGVDQNYTQVCVMSWVNVTQKQPSFRLRNATMNGAFSEWTFDINNATATFDSNRTSANDGRIVLATPVNGIYGNALFFNATAGAGSQYVVVNTSATLSPPSAITIAGWINTKDVGSAYATIVRKDTSYIFRLQTGVGALAGYIYSDSDFDYSAATGTGIVGSNSGWVHVAMTYDSTDGVRKVKLYKNGAEVSGYSTQQAVAPGIIDNNTNALYIGALSGTSHFFNGTIDGLQFYNRSLSAAEIAALYSQYSVSNTGVVLNLPFDSVSASGTTPDFSGLNNTGTLLGFNTTSPLGNATSGLTYDCRFGKCLRFDGVNDEIQLPLMSMPTAFTFSVDVRYDSIGWQQDIWRRGYSAGTKTGILMYISSSGLPSFVVGNGTSLPSISVPAASMTLGRVYNFIGTFNGTHIEFFINGTSQGSASLLAPVLFSSSHWLGSNDGTTWLNGTLGNVMLWNRSLSAQEISALYGTTVPYGTPTNFSAMQSDAAPNAILYKLPSNSTVDDMVAYYPLSEGAGTTTSDNSMNGNDGTLANFAGTPVSGWNSTDCKFGNCLKFWDGTQGVSLPNAAIPSGTDYSVSFWVNRNGWVPASNYNAILGWGNSVDEKFDIAYRDTGGNPIFYFGGWGTDFASVPFQTNTWYHAAIVVANNMARLIINGNDTGMNMNVTPVVKANFYIGRTIEQDGSLHGFNGTIDDVRVYNRTLSTVEVNALYNAVNATSSDSVTLGAGSYYYQAFVPNSTNATVGMARFPLTVTASPATITISGAVNGTYPYSQTISATSTSAVTLSLVDNGTAFANSTATQLKAGVHNISAYSAATANNTATIVTVMVNVSKSTPNATILINGTAANRTAANAPTMNVTGSSPITAVQDLVFNLYQNFVLALSGIPAFLNQLLSPGEYRFDYNTTGGENYTASSATYYVDVWNATSGNATQNQSIDVYANSAYNLTWKIDVPLVNPGTSSGQLVFNVSIPAAFTPYDVVIKNSANAALTSNMMGNGINHTTETVAAGSNKTESAYWTCKDCLTDSETVNTYTSTEYSKDVVLKTAVNGWPITPNSITIEVPNAFESARFDLSVTRNGSSTNYTVSYDGIYYDKLTLTSQSIASDYVYHVSITPKTSGAGGSTGGSGGGGGGGSGGATCRNEGASCVLDSDCCGGLSCDQSKCISTTKPSEVPNFYMSPYKIQNDPLNLLSRIEPGNRYESPLRITSTENNSAVVLRPEWEFVTDPANQYAISDWCYIRNENSTSSTLAPIPASSTKAYRIICDVPKSAKTDVYYTGALSIWMEGKSKNTAQTVSIVLTMSKPFSLTGAAAAIDVNPARAALEGAWNWLNTPFVCLNYVCQDSSVWYFNVWPTPIQLGGVYVTGITPLMIIAAIALIIALLMALGII